MSMLHEVVRGAPKNKLPKRKGRGESSGHGKTSGRGNKGSKARTGKYIKRGYEGGQTPIFKRFPKRGFSNVNFERKFHVVNLFDVDAKFDDGATVDATALKEKGLIPDLKQPVKILGQGKLTKKFTIIAGWYSKSAHEAIGQSGGTAQNLKGEAFAFPKPKKKFVPREGGVKKVGKKAAAAAAGEGGEAAPAAAAAAPAAAAPEAKPAE
jgi:large subunit ribosomal protein L15